MQEDFKNGGENPLIVKDYGIPTSLYGNAFKVFQRKYVYPRNYIMTVLFAGIAVYYIYSLTKDMENMLCWLMTALCLALTASLWYNPYKLRRNLVKSVENIRDDVYSLEIFHEYMTVEMHMPETDSQQFDNETVENSEKTDFQQFNGENVENEVKASVDEDFFSVPEKPEKTEIRFDSNIRIIEKHDFFIVYIVKSVFYIIPKKAFSEEEILVMQQHFENKLGKNFLKQK